MTPGRILFAFVLTVAGGVGWVAFDDRFGRPDELHAARLFLPPPTIVNDVLLAGFSLCAGPVRANCVVDGDTFWFRGEKIRIADIDAPEITQSACTAERQAGESSRDRLLAMLNEGRFSLTAGWRERDRYGRKLRIVSREGKSLGERLVEQGLARRWNGPGFGWCDRQASTIGGKS
jgi:endonuclease YncB( thermonuclease family)